jgi:hypothetical protein
MSFDFVPVTIKMLLMKWNFTVRRFLVFFLFIAGSAELSYSQAPNQPTNPAPVHQSGSGSINPSLCATVSDPNGGTLQVRYHGRKKPVNGSEKFTIVILPDTQYYTEEPQGTHDGGNIAMFNAQTTWIANNRAAKNIVYVGHLGDCVQNGDNPPGSVNDVEWQRAIPAITTIESPALTGLPQGIPFGICVGNHDQTPNGSATGTTNYYNQFFGSAHFAGRSYYGGHNGSNNDNHYQLFSASGVDFLVISFEYDQSAGFSAAGGALDWAEALVQTYSNRKVIVMTHYAINENTSFSVQGQAVYNRLRIYPNFSLFIGGHVHTSDGEAQRTDIYNGNTVHTILSDYQGREAGGNGRLRIYEFDPALNKISVKTYSPFTNVYETDADSQFELPFNMLPVIGQVNNVSSGTIPCFGWNNLSFSTEYEWDLELYDGINKTIGPVWRFTTPSGAALPVTLTRFSASKENTKVKLAWTIVNELNNDHFTIERSLDGSGFAAIGDVASRGNSVALQDYVFYDGQPLPGRSFYRLKQIDIDGHFKYSSILSIQFDKSAFLAWPNPVSGSGFINIHLERAIRGELKITVYDMSGREVFSETRNNVQHDLSIKPGLPGGLYTIQLTGDGLNASQKIAVIN